MRQLLLLLSTSVVALALEVPEFDDELLGRLVVSKKRFPFLTPRDAPDIVHVFPTDQQLNAIKAAFGVPQFTSRMKRSLDEAPDFPSDITGALEA